MITEYTRFHIRNKLYELLKEKFVKVRWVYIQYKDEDGLIITMIDPKTRKRLSTNILASSIARNSNPEYALEHIADQLVSQFEQN